MSFSLCCTEIVQFVPPPGLRHYAAVDHAETPESLIFDNTEY